MGSKAIYGIRRVKIMNLNKAQIDATIASLKTILGEQERILREAERIVNSELRGAWECEAQRAYMDAFQSVKENTLSRINDLIELFENALTQSMNGTYEVIVDLAHMNTQAYK